MTFIGSLLLKLSLLGVAVGGVFICKKLFKPKDDWVLEEIIEEAIKEQVGVEIDLTPETQEGHDSDKKLYDISSVLDLASKSTDA